MNRGGVYPQEDTVANLGVNLLTKGFNEDEANHEGVCVQEVPPEERKHDPVVNSAPYETYAQHNARSCEHAALKTCFAHGGGKDILYGTLSHSHLLLVLLCLSTGAEWQLPDN